MVGWTPIDPILSIGVAGLIIVNAWRLVKSAAHILLEGAPAGFDEAEVRRRLTEVVPGVHEVHHVHAWSLTSGQALLTLHATVSAGADPEAVLARIKDELVGTFGIAIASSRLSARAVPTSRTAAPDGRRSIGVAVALHRLTGALYSIPTPHFSGISGGL